MLENQTDLYVGAPRGEALHRTLELIVGKLQRMGTLQGDRLLDVGCGDGAFTTRLGVDRFSEIIGIDVQETYLESFRQSVKDDPRYKVLNMSASEMTFPNNYFDGIVTIETLEHVPDLTKAAVEMARVLKPGGELLITVPNRWFPFENHGMRIGGWEKHGRIPLLTYLPDLHRRFSLARVFTVKDLDWLFAGNGLKRTHVDYAWPTFEHGGNRFQSLLKPLFGVMRQMESSPFKMFGTSVITRYVKP